jgi:hypothetical protein
VHFNVANRKVHYWASFIAATPLVVIIATGILLQTKKQWDWVQPPEQRGAGRVPVVNFDRILAAVQSVEHLGVRGWEDVDRVDVRPGRGAAKVTLYSRWEVQVDLESGKVLQTAYRRSDLIESIHDGSFFAGDWTKLGLFLPAGVTLLLLWMSGVWMVWVQLGLIAALAIGPQMLALAQPRPLEIVPIVGHWETGTDGGEPMVTADARKWRVDQAETRFPLAAVKSVDTFSSGVLTVKFKLIGGESDQIAGIAFGISPASEYYYARYNTKDGNVALWRFAAGERHRLLDGTEHVQLPLNTWHELRVEVRGNRVVAAVNDALRIEHVLAAPVSGRVGFYTKRDSITAFKGFTLTR